MEQLKSWAENGSFHAISQSILAGSRSYSSRKIWSAIFTLFVAICVYLQTKLIYEILVLKPTIVELKFVRAESIDFPNVLICDLNQEFDKTLTILDAQFGNSGLLSTFSIQLSKNLLFEAMRREIRKNVSYVDNFPWMKGRYEQYYGRMDPAMARIRRKFICIYSFKTGPQPN